MIKLNEALAQIRAYEQLPAFFDSRKLNFLEDAFGLTASYVAKLTPGHIRLEVSPHVKAQLNLLELGHVLHLTGIKSATLQVNNLIVLEWES